MELKGSIGKIITHGRHVWSQPPIMNVATLHKWKVRVGKAMFAIKTTMKEEMLEHIRKAMMPNKA